MDATDGIMAVHQRHAYREHLTGDYRSEFYHRNPEGLRNVELAGGEDRLLMWAHATHRYGPKGLRFFLWGLRQPWNPKTPLGKAWYRSFVERKP